MHIYLNNKYTRIMERNLNSLKLNSSHKFLDGSKKGKIKVTFTNTQYYHHNIITDIGIKVIMLYVVMLPDNSVIM